MSININLKNDEDINFWEIGVSGELDVSTADEFKEYLHKLIDEEIRNIIVSDRIAAIIFRDKIEILVL